MVLSLLVLLSSELGHALSPYWAASLVLAAGVVAVFIRPTRLALFVTLHIILNMFSISCCLLAMSITTLYSTATRLPEYDKLQTTGPNNTIGDCLFSQNSPLYNKGFRSSLRGLDDLVSDCRDLSDWWKELLAIASLCLAAAMISFVGVVSNCATPCLEEQYKKPVKQYSWDISDHKCCCCYRRNKTNEVNSDSKS